MSSRGTASSLRSRHGRQGSNLDSIPPLPSTPNSLAADQGHYGGMKRHQLYDPPVPGRVGSPAISDVGLPGGSDSPRPGKKQTIKFDTKDLIHSYHRTGPGNDGRDLSATHEPRVAVGTPTAFEFNSVSYLSSYESTSLNERFIRTSRSPTHWIHPNHAKYCRHLQNTLKTCDRRHRCWVGLILTTHTSQSVSIRSRTRPQQPHLLLSHPSQVPQ